MMQNDASEWFLGSVDFDATKEHFTRLHPIAVISDNASRWEQLGGSVKSRFPIRGLVCWFSAPADTFKSALFEFQAVPNPTFDEAKHPDRLHVQVASAAIEVIQLATYTDRKLRELLTGDGVALPWPPVCRCLFKLAADRSIGPFDLVERKAGRWAIPAETDLESIPVHNGQPAPASNVEIEGKQRLILVTAGTPISAQRIANWQPDAEVLRNVLKRLHKLDIARFKKLELTYKAFDEYIAAVAEAKLLPDQQLAREHARVERLRELRGELPVVRELVDEIVDALGSFGAVKQRIKERLAALAQERKAEIDARVKAEKAELEKLQSTAAAARRANAELLAEIESRKKALNSDLRVVDEVMRDKLREIREAPARAVAEVLASSALLPRLLQDGASNHRPPALGVHHMSDSAVMGDMHAVREALAREFMRSGVALDNIFSLLAAFTAGLAPICTGDAAADAVAAFGRCLCGDNSWWLPVSPIANSLHDILASGVHSQYPVIAGLHDVIEAAHQQSDTLALAVLEGIDVASTDAFLLPLLGLAQTGASAFAHRVPMLTAGSCEVREWPRNLLLALTISGARTALPLPRRTWEFAPLLIFEWAQTGPVAATPPSAPVRLPAHLWFDACASAAPAETGGTIALGTLTPIARRLATRLFAAATALGAGADDAQQMTSVHVSAPALAAADGTLPPSSSDAAARHFDRAKALVSDNPVDT